jgi:hypothetical protein
MIPKASALALDLPNPQKTQNKYDDNNDTDDVENAMHSVSPQAFYSEKSSSDGIVFSEAIEIQNRSTAIHETASLRGRSFPRLTPVPIDSSADFPRLTRTSNERCICLG